jgi:acetate kinase
MSGCIAVLNAGSSSIKFAIYRADGRADGLTPMFRGQIERIGRRPRLRVFDAEQKSVAEREWAGNDLDHHAATEEIIRTGRELIGDAQIHAVGHRVVHGGIEYAAPVRVDAEVVETLARLIPLAPLHQPHNLEPIRVIAAAAPDLPQVACFDTAFHRSQPPLAQAFALPRRLSEEGVRRYGFHGLSYEFIVARLGEIDPALAAKRLVIAHLGNGASLAAVRDVRWIDITLVFKSVDLMLFGF